MTTQVPISMLVHRARVRHPADDEAAAEHLANLILKQHAGDPREIGKSAAVLTGAAELLQDTAQHEGPRTIIR